jgi:hypothetical protein
MLSGRRTRRLCRVNPNMLAQAQAAIFHMEGRKPIPQQPNLVFPVPNIQSLTWSTRSTRPRMLSLVCMRMSLPPLPLAFCSGWRPPDACLPCGKISQRVKG